MLVQVVYVAPFFDSKRMVDFNVTEEEKESYFGLIKFLCNWLNGMSGLNQRGRVIVFLADHEFLSEKLF